MFAVNNKVNAGFFKNSKQVRIFANAENHF